MLIGIKVFANNEIGTGHLYRQSWVAKSLKKFGIDSLFFIEDYQEGLKLANNLHLNYIPYSRKYSEEESAEFISVRAEGRGINMVIIDELDSSKSFINRLKKKEIKVITFDDRGNGVWHSDLCIAPLYPPKRLPPTFSKTKLLTGYKYMVLNEDYSPNKIKTYRVKNYPKRIYITQGGTDTYGVIPFLIKSLSSLPEKTIFDVVIGPAFKHHRQVKESLKTTKGNFKIHENKKKLLDIQEKADMAISAGGLTLFELLTLGVPTILLTAEPREKEIMTSVSRLKAVINIGLIRQSDFNKNLKEKIIKSVLDLQKDFILRKRISAHSRKLFKGTGLKLVTEEIIRLTRSDYLN